MGRESDRGGPAFNIIPKTGGNTFSGIYFGSFSGEWGQGNNIDDPLRALGFGDAPALRKNWDSNFSLGGPIKRDRIWFYANTRAPTSMWPTCTPTETPTTLPNGPG